MIQIRNVSEEMHAELKARAAQAGMSLSDFLKRELGYILETKSLAQVFEELEPIRTDIDRAVLLEVLEEDKRDRR